MKNQIIAKPISSKILKMDGISEKQIREHYGLYDGYVKKVNEVREKLKTVDLSTANQTYSELRALKMAEPFALNGVILHEAYFGNLGGDGTKPKDRVLSLIKKEFGSFEVFSNKFLACGMAVRGWVVFAYNHFSKKVEILGSDIHDYGAIWQSTPLLVMDVYEHAYMIDYGTKRQPYIEAFWKNIDWNEVEKRLEMVLPKK